MKPNDSPLPLTLLQADGSRFSLREVLGRERVLIALAPSPEWLSQAARREAQLEDYDLQVLAVLPSPAAALHSSNHLHIGSAEVGGESYEALDSAPRAILIGKDGGVKKIYEGEANLDEVLQLIDTMPMRQAEAQQHHEKRL